MNKLLALNTNTGGIKTNANNGNNSNVLNGNGGSANNFKVVVPPKIENPLGSNTLLGIGYKFINLMLALIVIAAVVVIVIAGFKMVIGGGNESQIAKQKKALVYAIAGLAVAFMSFAIVQIIQNLIQK